MLAACRFFGVAGSPSWRRLTVIFLVSAGLVMFWAAPALKATSGEYFRVGIGHNVVARGLTSFEDHGSKTLLIYVALLPYYLVTILLSFFPWSLLLPWLAGQLRIQRRAAMDGFTIYLLSGIGLVMGIFTLYNTRLPHYILPAFPFLTLLLARQLVGRCCCAATVYPVNGTRFLKNGVIGMTALNLVVAFVLLPLIKSVSPSPQLLRLAEPWLKPQMEFAAVDYDEPSLVWYFRGRVNGYFHSLPPDAIHEFMARPGPRFCVLPVAVADRLFPVLPEKCVVVGDVHGINVVNARGVHLRMILKVDSASALAGNGGASDRNDKSTR